jgi:hypothetical protein
MRTEAKSSFQLDKDIQQVREDYQHEIDNLRKQLDTVMNNNFGLTLHQTANLIESLDTDYIKSKMEYVELLGYTPPKITKYQRKTK